MSSMIANGERGAVAPVSALKMYRVGVKRKRVERKECQQQFDSGDESECKDEKNSSSPVCLAKHTFFSLPLGITELSGPAGVGKTQLALSLCADCVEPLYNPLQGSTKKKAVYIQLGGSSRFLQTISKRIEQMLLSRLNTSHPNMSAQANSEEVYDSLTRILVHWVCNSEELMLVLQSSLPKLLQQHNTVSLVVLDGIANLFRLVEHGPQARSNPWHDRAVTFFQISNLCKELSSQFGVPFLVLNECTSRIKGEANQLQQTILEPALGLAWAQCVNASFFVRRRSTLSFSASEKDSADHQKKTPQAVSQRILQCLKAPHISSEHSVAKFWIDRSGVVLL